MGLPRPARDLKQNTPGSVGARGARPRDRRRETQRSHLRAPTEYAEATGGSEADREPTDLPALVERVVENRSQAFEDAQIEADVDEEATPHVDPNEFRLVLGHLLKNAVDHAETGTEIQVAASQRPDAWLVEVRDYGSGIPDEHRAKIFDLFSRVGESSQEPSVGLAVAQAIVRRPGGEINVTSESGEGALFRIRLPKHDEASTLQASPNPSTGNL